MKKFIKKAVRKVERTTRKAIFGTIYKSKTKMTLNKVSEISGLVIPEEYKKLANKKLSHVSFSIFDLHPNCIYFCNNSSILRERHMNKIRENALFVVSDVPIEGCNNIICDQAGKYGRKVLNYIRNLSKAQVITVTGSVGKTSTKEMIASVLKQNFENRMVASAGNSNSPRRIAAYVQKVSFDDKVYLQEVGAAGDVESIVTQAAEILEPNIAVYTNIRDSHIEWYGSRENIAKDKLSLSTIGKKDGLAIINYDDEILRKHKFEQKTVSYSLKNKKATYYAKNIKLTSEGTSFTLVDTIEDKTLDVDIKVIGEHHILNALAGYAVGKHLGMKDKSIVKGIKKYKTSGVRQNLINLGKFTILADCFNSSYDAIKSILQTFNLLKPKNNGKKIAVFGDIFELGDITEKVHREVGKVVSSYEIDNVIFIGEGMKYAFLEYSKVKKNAVHCDSYEKLYDEINNTLKDDDIILFKASHGMHFSEVLDTLFGTDVAETSALSHYDFTSYKQGKFLYYLFSTHATIKSYSGNEENIKLVDRVEGLNCEKLGKVIFKGNKTIKEITLPESMVRLRGYCFKNSTLNKININKNLKQIGPGTFDNCKIESITLPEGFLVIEYKAFSNCKSLKEIYIPESTKKISSKAFLGSNKVTIVCKKGSFADRYASKNNIKSKYI